MKSFFRLLGVVVNFPASLLGEAPLTIDDLYGYDTYLEHAAGLPDGDRAEFLQRIVGFSNKPTLVFRLGRDENGDFTISQA